MQGEGQEFESPRLHQPCVRSTSEQLGTTPRTHHRRPVEPVADEPLIHVLRTARRPSTSGSLGGADLRVGVRRSHFRVGSHLNNWICSAERRNLRFRRVSQGNDPDRSQPVTDHLVRGWKGSSYKGHEVDALAPRADEGRGRLRKASGSREQTVIRRCPNGETRLG